MTLLLDLAAGICLLIGSSLALLAGLGLARFPDVLTRMHAQAKPAVLGLILVLLGTALQLRSLAFVGPLLLVVAFQALTTPVGTHMLARAHRQRAQARRPR